jgi:hypothetical protein
MGMATLCPVLWNSDLPGFSEPFVPMIRLPIDPLAFSKPLEMFVSA